MSKNIYNPNSHFFVDYTKLADPISSNYINDAFGPVKNSIEFTTATNEYRTTSFVRAKNTTDKVKVFAICDGEVLIVQQTDNPDKLNIILKPSQSYAPLKIKYFIYRGVNKDFLFDSNLNLNKVIEDEPDNPVLLKNIWTSYLNYNQPEYLKNGGTIENTDKVIYINQLTCPNDTPDDTLIENIFRRNINNADYQLTNCKKGTILGTFSEKIGLDIVLDDGDYILEHEEQFFKLDLRFARKSDHKFDIAQFQNNAGKIKKYKEHIHSFLDAAAFWGSHIDSGEIILNGQTKNSNNTEIYSNILIKYQTAFNIYTYIKKERNRTLSFKENKLITFENAQQYVNPCNNWPIYISKIIRSSTSLSPLLQIKIPYKIDTLISESEINIFWKCFTSTNTDKDSIYLKEENLVKSNIIPYLTIREEETLDNKAIKFKYLKINNTIYSTSNFIIISTIYNQELTFKSFYNYLWCANICPLNSFDLKKIVSATLITNNLINLHPIIGVNGTCLQQKVVFDYGKNINSGTKKRRLFISSISDVFIDKKEENTILISKGIKSNSSEVSSKAEYYKALYDSDLTNKNLLEKVSVFKGKVEDKGTIINTLTLISDTDYKIADRYFQLGITDDEYNKLFFNSSTISNTLYVPTSATNIYFTLEEIEIDYSKEYRKFKLGLSYENADGTTRETKFPSIENQVFIYTIDDKYYYSKDYSDYQIYYEEFAGAQVHFRTTKQRTNLSGDILEKEYNGEFGFDWLRIGDNGETAYRDNIISGYAPHSEGGIVNYEYESNIEAYNYLKKEYQRIPKNSNGMFYYTPYLNIFPMDYAFQHLNKPSGQIPPYEVELRVYVDIGERVEKLEFEYNTEKLLVNTNNSDPLKSNQLEDKNTIFFRQSDNRTIKITCLQTLSYNETINVFAYPDGSFKREDAKLAGRIIVLKNSRIIDKNIVLIPVKSNIDNGSNLEIGNFNAIELQKLRNACYQSLIYPTVEYAKFFENNQLQNFVLDISNDARFKVGGAFVKTLTIPKNSLDGNPDNIDTNAFFEKNDSNYLVITSLMNLFNLTENLANDYSNYVKVFAVDVYNDNNTRAYTFSNGISKSILLYVLNNKSADVSEINKTRNPDTLAHEAQHYFGIDHSHKEFKDGAFVNLKEDDYNKQFVFIHGQHKPSSSSNLDATHNIMSYVDYDTQKRNYLWKWQWDIIRK